MSRTGEIVLGVISAIMTLLSIILVTILVISGSNVLKDEAFTTEFQNVIAEEPTMTEADLQIIDDNMDLVIDAFNIFGWVFVIILVISLILNIIGIVSISKNKNPKLAGIMFIIAGLFAGILSPTSLLLYIAAIMCFVRKPPVQLQEEFYTTEKTL
ncbi:DUF4064 domain-containing protein [Psychrobacillus sp. INOP01]|uniref:DUF4064 domain-containing protein n=1 Tax=Psychrobacillus sp. INOP01 TaxID=2829187 RepID=UPI001BA87A92|nr:DUF4064 domain-containing protein [Psychrobacillus sp. INOP01]QUG43216.1 DUF4064 domain-containing protein [Psychrobacillus sp. INOP01]